MPTIDEKVRDYFTSDGTVSNTVGNRVWGGEAPANVSKAQMPFARYTRVSRNHKYTNEGRAEWVASVYQFDCVGKTRKQAIDLVADFEDSADAMDDDKGVFLAQVLTSRDVRRDERTDGFQAQIEIEIEHDDTVSTST